MENEIIQSKLDSYIEIYDEVKARTRDEQAAVAILQELNKDARTEKIQNGRANGNGDGSSPATEKQIGYLKKLGVEAPTSLTKREASALIDETLAKESE